MYRKVFYKDVLSFKTILLFLAFSSFLGCKKMSEVDPPSNALTSDNVYTTDATAASVVSGVYATLANFSPLRGITLNSLSLVSGLSGDELNLYGGSANSNGTLVQFYQNKVSPGAPNSTSTTIWSDIYSKIYIVNLALERLRNSTSLTSSVKLQLIGEGLFLRAFFYLNLINLYGDVPLSLSSDYRATSILSRTAKAEVYQQIIGDLKDAQNLLNDDYLSFDVKSITSERVRPNKWAATALLARVYLYTDQFTDAVAQSTSVINNKSKYDTVSLNNVFLKNSKEAIWQLQPVNIGWNTEDAKVFILPSTGPTSNSSVDGYPVYLSNELINSFEPGDKRKSNWTANVKIGSGASVGSYYYAYKYKNATLNSPVTEYAMVLRLGEQYLIRAEARAQLNNINDAQSDLNLIRARAGLPNTLANDKNSLFTAIQHERQVELFTEWGHRWFDLKRTNSIDNVMATVSSRKGTTWNPNWALYPIPAYDIIQDPHLNQNFGY